MLAAILLDGRDTSPDRGKRAGLCVESSRFVSERVFVTGAAGFIGTPLVRWLCAEGHDVVGTHRRVEDAPDIDIDWLGVNLLELDVLRAHILEIKPAQMIMLAWPAATRASDPGLFEPWLEHVDSVLQAFAEAGGERFVGVGSCMEYDWSDSGLFSESTDIGPSTVYGESKASAFEIVGRRASELGVDWAWARPFFLYGPGEPEKRLVPDVVTSLLAGSRVACSEGTQRRDFMYVDDVGQAIGEILLSDVTGAVNVGSGVAIKVRDLVSAFGDYLDRGYLIDFGARPMDPHEVPEVRADTNKLASTGFKPQVSLSEGVAQTVRYWDELKKDEAR